MSPAATKPATRSWPGSGAGEASRTTGAGASSRAVQSFSQAGRLRTLNRQQQEWDQQHAIVRIGVMRQE